MDNEIRFKVNVLALLLALQLAFIGVFILNHTGIEIPLLRQFIGSIYLLFVPGALLLLILRIHEIDATDAFLYSIGLSLSFIMILGLILNFGLPLIGVDKPISEVPFFIALTILFITLFLFCTFRRKEEANLDFEVNGESICLAILFSLPLFLSIFGAYFVYYKDNNLPLLIFLVIIAVIPFSSLSKRLQSVYPFIIFFTSLSLIYHIVLSSPYSFGGDAHIEYGFSNLVRLNGIWDPSAMANNNNAMASLNILIPSFCDLCKMSVTQVFKLIFPIVLSSVPLCLYSILRKQIKPEYAFLSSYFFLSIRPFYMWISEFVKQGFAMFFLMLIILTLVTARDRRFTKEILLILFSFSLIVSHYGTSYIFMISLIVVFITSLFYKRAFADRLSNYLPLYIVLAITWYIYVSQGSAFDTVVHIGNHVISNIAELFNPEAAEGLRMLEYMPPVLSYKILKVLHLITDFFIVLGFLSAVFHRLKQKIGDEDLQEEYFLFSIPSLGFLLLSIALPYFIGLGSMGFQRIYPITLLFLAPLCIIGGVKFVKIFERFITANRRQSTALKILAVFFAVFLLFNSGWVTEVAKEERIGSVAISQPRIKFSGTVQKKASLYNVYFAEEDVFSARWLSKHRINSEVCSDYYSCKVLSTYGGLIGRGSTLGEELLTNDTIRIPPNSYIYLRKVNWKEGIMTKSVHEKGWIWNTSDIIPALNRMDKIYSNGGSVIFLNSGK